MTRQICEAGQCPALVNRQSQIVNSLTLCRQNPEAAPRQRAALFNSNSRSGNGGCLKTGITAVRRKGRHQARAVQRLARSIEGGPANRRSRSGIACDLSAALIPGSYLSRDARCQNPALNCPQASEFGFKSQKEMRRSADRRYDGIIFRRRLILKFPAADRTGITTCQAAAPATL